MAPKKKSMEREKQRQTHSPSKNVTINVTVEGDNQSSRPSQKIDDHSRRTMAAPIMRTPVQDQPDEGVKEKLASAIQNLDMANDRATQLGIQLPARLQTIPGNVLDVKNSADIQALTLYVENMTREIGRLIQAKSTASTATTSTTTSTFVPPARTFVPPASTFVPPATSNFYTPYTPSYTPPYIPPPPPYTGYVPPTTAQQGVTGGTAYVPPVTKGAPTSAEAGGMRRKVDYERIGDALRDQTVVRAQLAIQEGDLPVLMRALIEVNQAIDVLNMYMVREQSPAVDKQLFAQVEELQIYVNQLTQVIATKQAEEKAAQSATSSGGGGAGAPPPKGQESTQPPASDLVSKFNKLSLTFQRDVNTTDKEALLMLRSRVADLISQARDENNQTIFQSVVGYDDLIVEKLSMIPDQPPGTTPPTVTPPPDDITLVNRKQQLQGYLAAKPPTTRQRSAVADTIISNEIQQKISLIDAALANPNRTSNNGALDFVSLDNTFGNWAPIRALNILKKGPSNRLDKVELKDAGNSLYNLVVNDVEQMTGPNNDVEVFFTSAGELANPGDIKKTPPPSTEPPSTQPPATSTPVVANEFVPFLQTEKRVLESYLASKPSTSAPRSIQADSVITTRISNKLNLINMAAQKTDLTDDEFDVAMTNIPINIIRSWPVTRALGILRGETLKPGRRDTVELRLAETQAGEPQKYKLFYNQQELRGPNNEEVFFTQDGEIYTEQVTPPPISEATRKKQDLLNQIYTTGNPLITEVARVLKNQIEADDGGGTMLDRANLSFPAAYAAISVGVNDQRQVKTVQLVPMDMTSFGGSSDQAYNLLVDGVLYKEAGSTKMFNKYGEHYSGVDYGGGYIPVINYPYNPNWQTKYAMGKMSIEGAGKTGVSTGGGAFFGGKAKTAEELAQAIFGNPENP